MKAEVEMPKRKIEKSVISTDLSTISDSSKPTDSSVTTFTREYGSPEPTSSPSDAFSTSSSLGQTTMFFPHPYNCDDDPVFSYDTNIFCPLGFHGDRCEFYPFTGQCQNGTIWNGKECVCAQGFFGYQCKSLVDSFFLEIPEIINATLGVTVKVTNKNFTKDLNNISSPDYWNFTQLFKSQMDKAYMGKDFPQYRGVIIRRLFNGSVVVEHDVIMEANYTSEFEELFANLSKLIKVKIMNETKRLSGDSEECRASSHLCFSEEATIVSENVMLGFDLKEQCTQKAAKDYAQFYFVDELDGKLACVTKCTSGTKLQLNCNEGECQLQRSGPRCLCPTSDTHWYWGETCALSTSKSLVYGSVGAVGALLVVMVVILTVFLGRSQRKLHRQEYNLWQGEDLPGGFQNTGIWEDENLKEDRFTLENIYSHFQPSLENVDPTTELHIQRPRVLTTAHSCLAMLLLGRLHSGEEPGLWGASKLAFLSLLPLQKENKNSDLSGLEG
ncbi:mucin-12 [Prionailurus viverrinus]|uniref:mucin-12 n=1 Tax=Prionailurus viverrinus TaxID=61388 RepID=UPI001FF2BC6B|nr:mucin-12 [Prionailurus viverrinus]